VDDPTDEAEVLRRVWDRERRVWLDILHGHGLDEGYDAEEVQDLIEGLLVGATLGRAFAHKAEVVAFLERQRGRPVTSTGTPFPFKWLARRLRRVFPPGEGGLVPPIAPDPLADYVMARRLPGTPALVEHALPTAEEMTDDPQEIARRTWRGLAVLERVWAGSAADRREEAWGWIERATASLADRFKEAGADSLPYLKEMDRRLLSPEPEAPFRLEPAHRMTLQPLAAHVWKAMLTHTPEADRVEQARLRSNLGNVLSALGRREEALAATQEAVRTLLPFFQAYPPAFRGWMQTILKNYLHACQDAGQEPDGELVQAILEVIGKPGD